MENPPVVRTGLLPDPFVVLWTLQTEAARHQNDRHGRDVVLTTPA
jgi:hypothetical protein